MPPIDFTRRTALYRLFDQEGRLLYVGVAFDPEVRWQAHRTEKAWWDDVADQRVEWHASRSAALSAEVVAIKTESPIYNVISVDAPVLRHVVRKPGGLHPHSFDVAFRTWDAYGEMCAEKGVARSADLRMYIKREVAAWRRQQQS